MGEVTVLVNNAGVISGKKFFDVADKMADLTLQVNTAAHFWVSVISHRHSKAV